MANTLYAPRVRAVLDRLFAAAALQEELPPPLPEGFSFTCGSAREPSAAAAAVSMPISALSRNLPYELVRARRPKSAALAERILV